MSSSDGSAEQYIGVVFKRAPPTADFSCSTEVVLPGRHTEQGAWDAVREALAGPERDELVGGEIRAG